MPTELKTLQRRGADSVIQTRCDRRTLAVLVQYFSRHQAISSLSALVREALELTERAILSKEPDLEMLTMEEAEEVLGVYFGNVNLNPQRRNMRLYQEQLERESAFYEGRPLDSVHGSRIKKGQQISSPGLDKYLKGLTRGDLIEIAEEQNQQKTAEPYQPRMPDNVATEVPEELDEAVERRKKEEEELKSGLGTVPEGIVDSKTDGFEGQPNNDEGAQKEKSDG